MLTKVDKHSGVPAYIKIMNIVKKEIMFERLKIGDQLPPVRELASRFGVNTNTV
jgi:GntR family transcriptional regulator